MKYAARLLLAVFSVVAAVILCEGMLRFFPQYRFENMVVAHICTDYPAAHYYRSSRQFGYELVPHVTPEINAFGMRDKEYSLRKPDGVYRVLLLGDSVTEWGKWSEYAEEKLNAGGRCEILNSAVSGWGLYSYGTYLRLKGMQFAPDLVLIGFCLNDLDDSSFLTMLADNKNNTTVRFSALAGDRMPDPRLTSRINPFLFAHSYLYRFLAVRTHRGANPVADRGFHEKTMREMKSAAGGRIAAVIYPYLKPLDRYTPGELNDYAEIKRLLTACGIDYFDLTGVFQRTGERIHALRERPADQVHYNDKANRMAADVLYPWLKAKMSGGSGN